VFNKQGIVERLSERLHLKVPSRNRFHLWETLLSHKREKQITIAIAGKYTDLEDSYASVVESLVHCSYVLDVQVKIEWIDTTKDINTKQLDSVHGVIIPGGFGSRGIEGKLAVIKYVRENKIPCLGICYGLQLAVIEFLKDVCGIKEAMTTEIEPDTKHPVITMLDEQKKVVNMGGTMRLGAYRAKLSKGVVDEQYREVKRCDLENGACIVSERHRHRYEVNPKYISEFEKHGLKVVGYSHERQLVEFVELDSKLHPYFVATQAHPELTSKLETPAPLFYGLVKYALERAKSKKN
jgi:CTP synthase